MKLTRILVVALGISLAPAALAEPSRNDIDELHAKHNWLSRERIIAVWNAVEQGPAWFSPIYAVLLGEKDKPLLEELEPLKRSSRGCKETDDQTRNKIFSDHHRQFLCTFPMKNGVQGKMFVNLTETGLLVSAVVDQALGPDILRNYEGPFLALYMDVAARVDGRRTPANSYILYSDGFTRQQFVTRFR